MRYVTYVLTPRRGYFDLGEQRMRANEVYPDSILDIDFQADGTILQRMTVQGSERDARACFTAGEDGIVDVQVSAADDATVLQLHYQPSPLTRDLLAIHRRHAVLLDYPLEYVGPAGRSLRVSEVGPEDALQSVIAETREAIDVEIEQLGSYDPASGRPVAALTERQREVLTTAVDAGYYEVPREVTYADVAGELGCSAGAVGQHLRRIESQIVPMIAVDSGPVDGGPDDEPAPTTRP